MNKNKLHNDDKKLDFSDVLIVPKYGNIASRKEVNLIRKFTFLNNKTYNICPIVSSNMVSTGTISIAKKFIKQRLMTAIHKHYDKDTLVKHFNNKEESELSMLTVGIEPDINLIKECNPNFICLDVANGYMQKVLDVIELLKFEFPDKVLCVGNVVTPEILTLYYERGVEIAKIGIGSGAFCTTRIKTGIGYPQLSAISDIKSSITVPIYLMSDGGCTSPGDICKSICAGSDFVMIGGMLSGHDECELEFREDDHGEKYAYAYGMSSSMAMEKHNGGMNSYRTSEGRVVKIKPKGPINSTVVDILGGLRSCGSYLGCDSIEQYFDNSKFVKVNHQVNTYFERMH